MSARILFPPALYARDYHGFFDDFHYYVSTDLWTTVATNSGTATVSDGDVGGVLTLAPSDGSVVDNDEIYVSQTTETFLFADGKPLQGGCRITWTEAATDDANVMFGFANAWAANHLQDNGAGPPDSYSGAVFFKVDGGTTWQCESSIGSTQTTTDSQVTAGGGYQELMIEIIPETSTSLGVMFYIDGEEVRDPNSNRRLKHTITLGSPTDMELGFGAKNGDSNNESIDIDYAWAFQKR